MNMKKLSVCLLLGLSAIVSAEEARVPGLSPAIEAPKAAENRLLDVTATAEHAFAVGQHGVILRSSDGKRWEQRPSPVSVMLTRVNFTDGNNGWALGYDATILRSRDAGDSWTLAHFDPQARALFDLLFLDQDHGIAVGAYGTMLVTRDGGESWTEQDSALGDIGMHLNSIIRLGDGSLFIAGERGMLARSEDAGETWQVLDGPYGGSAFGALPLGERGVVIYGMRGNVFMAQDVSACAVADASAWDSFEREVFRDAATIKSLGWASIESPTLESLFGALSLAPNRFLLVGVNGVVLHLNTTTRTILEMEVPPVETLVKMTQFKDHVLAVGRRGVQTLDVNP